MSNSKSGGAQGSIRQHLIVGLAIVLILGGGIGGWGATAGILGALIAPGSVVGGAKGKKGQQPAGGVVGGGRGRDGGGGEAGGVVGGARGTRHKGGPWG